MEYRRLKGSFTVEAALIMPLILGVTVLFIYIAMFCYDRCAIEYVCRIACAEAVYSPDGKSAAEEYIKDNLTNKLICRWDTEATVYSDSDIVTVEVRAQTGVFNRTFDHTVSAYKHFCPKY